MIFQEYIQGRLLPVPVELTGGCGIGWTSKIEDKVKLETFICEKNLKIKQLVELEF